jgi:hypothetical protein
VGFYREDEGTLEASMSVPTGSIKEPLLNRRQEKSDQVWTFKSASTEMGTQEREVVYVCGREPRRVGQKPHAWVVYIQLGIRSLKTVEEGHEMKERPGQCAQTYMALLRGFLLSHYGGHCFCYKLIGNLWQN